jgi:hypothetical protein
MRTVLRTYANFTIAVQGLTAREKNPFKFG